MIEYTIPTDLASYDSEADLDAAIDGYLQNLLVERKDAARAILETGSQADIDKALDAVAEVTARIDTVAGVRRHRERSRTEALALIQGPQQEDSRVLAPFKALAAEASTTPIRKRRSRLSTGDKATDIILSVTAVSALVATGLVLDLVLAALHVSVF